ncbi:hypothetical protein [Streptomyces ehimensis]|uniref:Helix-turn-helix domain-containing protein n=1 Tax=Streptomyces ehimensis TaxID=68195 RepID=A0ABV9BVS5_9ACTN
MPNEIIRHPRLSSDAVRLLAWALSMADEALEPLSKTARRAGIGKTAFSRAKRELVTEGFLHEWRRQGGGGRWATQQMISNVPLTAIEAEAARDGRPGTPSPAAGEPKGRGVGRPLKKTVENKPNLPSPSPAMQVSQGKQREGGQATSASATAPRTVPAPLLTRGGQALAAVSHSEPRLRLSGQDLKTLAPLAADWLQLGATMADIKEALTQRLPDRVHSPAGLVRDRLIRKRPPASVCAEQQATEHRGDEGRAAPRVAEMRECAGEHVQPLLFRPVDGETLCPSCRCAGAEACVTAAVDAAVRGGAAIRELLRSPRPRSS